MQYLARSEIQLRALRTNICRQCTDRPEGSETLPPSVARSCEPNCPIFINLEKLEKVIQQVDAPTMGPYELLVQDVVCQYCRQSPTAGDYCSERTTGHCPLTRNLQQVIDTLERVDALPGKH